MKKKLRLIIVFIALIIIVFIGMNWKINKDYLQDKGKKYILKVAGDINFPPFEYIDEKGKYTGFNVDIIRAVSLSCGIEVEFYPMKWEEACKKLKNGQIDIIQGMKYNQERKKLYDFSKGYLENSQSIFILTSNNKIDGFEKLLNHKVAIQKGDVAYKNLNLLSNVTTINTTDQEEAFKKLLNGEVDAYIGNTLTGVNLINKLKVRDKLKIVDTSINFTEYCIAVKKGDKNTLDLINKGLKEIKSNGTYESIYRKWFGYSINSSKLSLFKILKITLISTVILISLILIFYMWNDILKEEVEKQTQRIEKVNKDLILKNKVIKGEKDFREQILNNIFNGVITINGRGVITFINTVASDILNLNVEGIIGKNFYETNIASIFNLDVLEKGKEIYIEVNKEKKFINYRVNMLKINYEWVDEIIINFNDITEEKFLQHSLARKDKMQSLGILLSGIAHEIRNPLTAIKTYAELIPQKYDNEKFRKMICLDIPKEAKRLNNLIVDLLEYSKPRKAFKEKINLLIAIEKVISLMKNKIKEKNIKTDVDISEDIYVYMDKNHFKQVLINIILNSIESIDKENKVIDILAKVKNNKITLSIRDNGCGIDEKDIERIYNPFYTTKSTGTGLGLFVSYQLLEENNVLIYFNSIKGKGTIFNLEFYKIGDE
ncbi:transporter substrate-binding domain-containing protein [Clostridium rectalis]|uniref:transporter substrate-binding domain-containing protein n=1 Tax=Clostridium rectalis TaxID=2040295 RepID=UPI000F62C750|nr:transporter substrate-binding domain-containing protein [Clostridium rectalis]